MSKSEKRDRQGKITIIKVHKDDPLTYKAIKLDTSERGKFLSELTSLARKLT